MTLRNQAFSGIRWTTFSSLGRCTLQVLQVVILARLLAPSEFGLIAIVLAIVAFLQIFADAGVSNAIVHFQNITHEQLSSLFWLNIGISVVLALILGVISPFIAHWYQQPLLTNLLILASMGLVLNAVGQQLKFKAQKELHFAHLAKLELGAALCGFTTAVFLAWYGAGVYSLSIGGVVNAGVGSLIAWLILAQGWRPQMRFRLGEIQRFLSFGAYMIGNNLANTFNSQVDVLLGGRLLGAYPIGLYSVSKNLTLNVQSVINPIVTQVGFPVMARAQQDTALLKRIYLQTMRMTASVNFPIYIGMAFFAPEIVNVLLGPKWIETIPLLRILALWGLLRSIGNPVGSLLFAKGRADLAFKWNLVLLLIAAPSVWVGSHFGIQGMAIAITSLMALLFVPNWYFLIRPLCHVGLREYTTQLAVPLLASAVAGICAYAVAEFFTGEKIRLAVGIFTCGSVYLGASYLINRVWIEALLDLLLGRPRTN